ncbi:MAG: PHB depolymerase family esterase [Acidobacteriota bacterium]
MDARPSFAQRAEVKAWRLNGETRRAIVYAPSAKTASGRAPLVLSFHGHGDNMQNFQHTDLHRAWPEAIVVYFQGLPSRDGLAGWQVEKGQDDDRDLALVDAAITSLREEFKVDEARVYSTGFSNGANFTYLLWAERPGVFAAFAPVAARLRPSVKLMRPKPIVHIAGTGDAQIRYADQLAAIEAARRANGATGKGTGCGGGCTIYDSPSGAPVMTWIHPGGHEYPDSTSERIAKFFRQHPAR